MLVSLKSVSFSYGDNLIFSGVDLAVNEGEKIGLIGGNGEGKSTLLKLITGEYTPESGEILRKNGMRVGYLAQDGGLSGHGTVYAEAEKVFSRQLAALSEYQNLSARVAEAEYGGEEYARISARMEAISKYLAAENAYDIPVRIAVVLNGMGFKNRFGDEAEKMSGGEKTRLKLARLLLEQPDLLVLDEPTNHLDADTLFWLEDYLQTFRGALLVVSHDRYFLDRTVTRTAEIENGKLLLFKGNYSKYKILKSELYARRLKEWEAQCAEREKLQTYVDKNIVRATTAKSAQSRVKQLDKMEILEKPYTPPPPPRFSFTYSAPPYERVLDIENIDLERGGKRLISAGQLKISRGEKVALVGANGTGKTSLIKEILSGNKAVQTGRFVKIAYYDQEGANLNGDACVLEEFWNRHTGITQTEARSALAACGLSAEDMQKKVRALSGGERAKLALCELCAEHGNFIIMDEPTNHLDLPARESLENALREFDGTLLIVSHDRYLLSAVATRVAEIADGRLKIYEGGYNYYAEEKRKAAQMRALERENERIAERNADRAKSYRSRAERAAEEKRKSEAKRIEGEISALEEEENALLSGLALPEVACDYKKTASVSARLEEIRNLLDALYKEYESVL